jgi:hypothetical protein
MAIIEVVFSILDQLEVLDGDATEAPNRKREEIQDSNHA